MFMSSKPVPNHVISGPLLCYVDLGNGCQLHPKETTCLDVFKAQAAPQSIWGESAILRLTLHEDGTALFGCIFPGNKAQHLSLLKPHTYFIKFIHKSLVLPGTGDPHL